MSLLTTHCDLDDLGSGRYRQTINPRRIAYAEDGVLKRGVDAWTDGDAARPHVVTRAAMMVYAAPDGMYRVCPTREADVYAEIGAPYVKPAGTWTKVNLGAFSRSGNVLTATNAGGQVRTTITFGGHFIKPEWELLGGYVPPNGQFAFPVGLNGLTRSGGTFYKSGVPVMSIRPPIVYDKANPLDARPIASTFAQVGGQWYAVFTLPSLVGMSQPVVDPTLVLQPDASDGIDNYLNGEDATRRRANNGVSAGLQMGLAAADWGPGRPMLRISLSSIPAGAVCQSAVLRLANTANAAQTATVTAKIHAILAANSGWVEGTKDNMQAGAGEPCWNAKAADGAGGVTTAWAGSVGCGTSGTDYEATALGQQDITDDAAGTTYDFALTANRVQAWFGSDAVNYGVIGLATVENSVGTFAEVASSDNATAARRPKWTVVYTVPGRVRPLVWRGIR